LLAETRRYIKGIVAASLDTRQPVQNHPRQIVQAAQDPFVSRMEIFTLNHDLLIEKALRLAGIPFVDGFVPVLDDLRSWDRESFVKSPEKVRLNKLHGSIDWFDMPSSNGGPSRVCIATNGDINHTKGSDCLPFADNPAILIGTFNKMLDYTTGIYADLFCSFRTALSTLDKLVISGYSFGDKGVNASFEEWTRQSGKRRVLIIAPDASACPTARGAIRRLFSNRAGQITPIDEGFEDVTWERIRGWCNT
jgi:hypothetical protein